MENKSAERTKEKEWPEVTCIEEDYSQKMRTVVEPFLGTVRQTGELSVSGGNLYYETFSPAENRGTIVICHGFTESVRKYDELIYYFLNAGYQVVAYDQRGHGLSLREGSHPDVVHVERFSDYLDDLHAITEKIVRPLAKGGKKYLYSHSMGGCVAALYIETYPNDYEKAVLNAPMLAIQLAGVPAFAATMICKGKRLLGKGKSKLFFHGDFEPDEKFKDSCSTSECRQLDYLEIRKKEPAYRTSSASYQWAENALKAGRRAIARKNIEKIQIPVLLFTAGRDNQVKEKAQEAFIRRLCECGGQGRRECIPDAKHEIYRSPKGILEPYVRELIAFYGE